ncbi:N-acetylmuramic acid 6-phosphate etherase [Vagococcus fluvialis]|uniref:N-acetylmuramic acid 6-phosphate etherase n=1 Tax=Vagococcus fluvialis TaxID=2738 RepID=UPI003B5D035F
MLENLTTEKRNEDTLNLDKLSIIETVTKMNQEDERVIAAIEKKKESIATVIEQVVKSLKNGGKLFYFGAGTSGRLGILDAAECVPTFSTDPELVQGIIAGGESAMTVAVEGAEDSITLAEEDFRERGLTDKDIVIGISASGRTPYVIGGLKYAAEIGATTASISCNENAEISTFASFPIEVTAGPEILTGSTRLKSGTLQKLILNMISTISMVHLGKVYGNLMVDVKPTNEKLVERAKNIIVEATGCTKEEAAHYFEDSDEQVKLAIIRILTKTSKEEGLALLEANDGFIRKAVDNH